MKLKILKAISGWDYRSLSEDSGIPLPSVQAAFLGRGKENISYLYDFMLARLTPAEVETLFEVLADINEYVETPEA
ncbi:MAG: hypothetical protein ACRC62_21885 [Microcoleus sp.]